ncbi:hypothetical protein SETIT_4G215000v2 [Setaria italica]|uniref:ATP-dependent DNA helicase n=1 Tax=Setaria italica TaxID=4555 RepID=A0A368QWR0_SETIT|nr:hypothetical protein SETIT_4G215000v2 [Setaria italica]
MLTEYFKMNTSNPKACQYLYKEFPEYFTWNKSGKFWKSRVAKNRLQIGRLVYANPCEGDRYYLWVLLNHDKHYESLAEDFRHTNDNYTMVEQMVLRDISYHLTSLGKDIRHYGLPKLHESGDFRQFLPVVAHGTRAQIAYVTLLRSYIWESVRRIRLTQNMRAQSDTWFVDYLLRIGNDTEETFGDDYVQLPDDILIDSPSEDICINTLIDHMRERAILSTRNEHVDVVNALMMERFSGSKMVYYNFDLVEDDPRNNYPLDFLNSITPNGLPPHELVIKKNCSVILFETLILTMAVVMAPD